MIEGFFKVIFRMSTSGIFCIAFAFAARLFLNRCARRYSYILWLLVFLCFCIPFSLPAPVNLIPEGTIQTQITSSDVSDLPYNSPSATFSISQANGSKELESSASFVTSFYHFAPYIWLMGAVILCSYSILAYIRLKTRLRSARTIDLHTKSANNINTAIVFGFLHGCIFIPDNITGEVRDCVLQHSRYGTFL